MKSSSTLPKAAESNDSSRLSGIDLCGVEMWRGGLGAVYLLPTLSSVGASLTAPCFRFHIPLIEPDRPVSGIRLSEKVSRCRPRETARPRTQADEAELIV